MWSTTPTIRHRAAALVAALALATALAPLLGPAPPAGAAGDGPIVFASELGGDFDVTRINPDGTGRTNLTASSPADDMGPVWFGTTKIAFASDRDGDFDIYTMNADGSGVTQITQSPGYDARPTWSPDGTKIAFVSARSGKNQIHIQSVSAPGAASTQRTYTGANTAPSWGVGNRITFTRKIGDSDNEIQVMNADGSGLIAVTNNAADDRNSRWISPTRLIFQSNLSGIFGLIAQNVDGSSRVVVASHGYQPSMSPSGNRMVIVAGSGSYQEIWATNANGSPTGAVRLTTDGAKDETPDWGNKPITLAPREQKITNIVAQPTGLTTWVTFKTSRLTDDAHVELRQNGSFMRWAFDQGGPTRNHSLVVRGLKPGVPYTLKVFAPKLLTSGEVVVNAGSVTTHTRKVEITAGYADVIDDGDEDTCGEIVLVTIVTPANNVWTRWGDYAGGDYLEICSGGTFNPDDKTLVVDGVTEDELQYEVKADEDDDHFFCVIGDDCVDRARGIVTIPVLNAETEAMVGSGTVHMYPEGDSLEMVWHYTYKVTYHA